MLRSRFRFTLINLAIALLLMGLILPTGTVAWSAVDKVEPAVLSALNQGGQATFLVYMAEQADLSPAYHMHDWNQRGWFVYNTLHAVAERTQRPILQALNSLAGAGHVNSFEPYYIVNLIVVHGDRAAVRDLAQLPGVARIYPEMKIELVAPVEVRAADTSPQAVEWNISKIRADLVWSTYGVTGTGSVVANIDTGVDYTHPALVTHYRGNLGGGNFEHNYNWWDPTFAYTYPYPISGDHGTHVMGTEIGDDGAGNQIGVAPGAKWIAAYGCCPSNEALLSATQWMIAPTDLTGNNPNPSMRPYAVNNSWGGPGGSLIFNSLLEAQQAAGIFVAFSAGNSGPRCASLGSPGDNPASFSSGATDINDYIASFSSRGPNPFVSWMGRYGTGPDLSAPGQSIRSSIPGGIYASYSGTSMASPHTAGAVGLLWSAEPDLVGRVEETEEILRKTSVPLYSTQECGGVSGDQRPNNVFGWGRLDIYNAVTLMWHAGAIGGVVVSGGTGQPIPGASLTFERSGVALESQTDGTGAYEYVLGAGSYTVTAWAQGYEARVVTQVLVEQDITTPLDLVLNPLPVQTLSGTVQEGAGEAPGDPVTAQVGVWPTDILVGTDPATGAYSSPIPTGAYGMRVVAPGYLPEERLITVTGDLIEDFGLTPTVAYYARDSRSPCGPTFNWIDATDGNAHNLADDSNYYLDLYGTPFPFYGDPYEQAWVGSNGYVTFGSYGYYGAFMIIPFEATPNSSVYAFEDDLNPADGAQGIVYDKIVDGRYVVIEYYQVEHWQSGDPETFEIILDTQTGAILIQYLEVSWPDYATVGIENWNGSDGYAYSMANSGNITNSLAVGFYPVYGGPPAGQDPVGVVGNLSGTVYISGTTTPIPGATVGAWTFLNAMTTTTDLAGQYLFEGVCADLYWLAATAPEYRPSAVAEARLRYPGAVAVTDLEMEPTQADPHLAKSVSTVTCGNPLTYTLALSNVGDGTLYGVLSDTLPAQVYYITSTPPGFYQNGSLTWSVELVPGTSTTVQIVGAPLVPPRGMNSSEMVTNTAFLFWNGPTLSASAAYEFALLDLYLTKTVEPASIWPGDPLTYTLEVANEGCDMLLGAVLSDTLPAGVVYMTSTPPGLYQDGTLTWPVDLGNGEHRVITVVGYLTGTAIPGTTVENTAYLLGEGGVLSSTASFIVQQPGCQPVEGALITWSPAEIRVGEPVVMSGTVTAGDLPIDFTWDLGDGYTGTGSVITHVYTQTGLFTVTLTATNCGSAGFATVSRVREVEPFAVYLPLIMRAATP